MNLILELGGNPARLYRVIELAHQYSDTKIIVSSEGSPDHVVGLLRGAGIPDDRFILDFKAWDTVTNFTETKQLLRGFNPAKIFIVTDNFHMRRAMKIANAVYWLSGISLIAEPYMGSEPHDPEPNALVRQDAFRAWLWRLIGILKYDKAVKEQRMPALEADEQHSREQGYPVSN